MHEEKKQLYAFSVNYSNTSLEIRDRLALPQDLLQDCYATLIKTLGITQVFLLSTCNRTELYAYCTDKLQFTALLQAFCAFKNIPFTSVCNGANYTGDYQVCTHLLRVACGMDSMVVGEPQILGQLKSAYSSAKNYGALGSDMEQLLQFCFSRVKEIRTAMPLGREPVSLASNMVRVVQQIFDTFANKHLLLVGAGETIDLVARYMIDLGITRVTIVNRTLEKAQTLAKRYNAQATALFDVPGLMPDVDLLVSATASQLPIIGKGMIEQAMVRRRDRSLVMFDLAVPRDIEPQVKSVDGVYVYTIDDLGKIIENNRQQRLQAAKVAEQCIDQACRAYQARKRETTIGRYVVGPLRNLGEEVRDQELNVAMKSLARGDMPEFVIYQLAHGLTKKLLHQSSVQARRHVAVVTKGEDHLQENTLLEEQSNERATRH